MIPPSIRPSLRASNLFKRPIKKTLTALTLAGLLMGQSIAARQASTANLPARVQSQPEPVPGKFASDLVERLGSAAADEQLRVVVELTETPGERLKSLLGASGGVLRRNFRNLSCAVIEAPAGTISQIAELDEVSSASLDDNVTSLGDTAGHIVTTTGALAVEDEHPSRGGDGRPLGGRGIGGAVKDAGVSPDRPWGRDDKPQRATRGTGDITRE